MKKVLLAVILAVIIVACVVLARSLGVKPKAVSAEPAAQISVDENLVAQHLSRAVQFKTISFQDPAQFEAAEFFGFHQFLQETYPRMHQALAREVVAKYSLLYTWKGKDPKRKPILLMAHMDVVPVFKETENQWSYPAFEGRIAEGFIWGRGSLDDKGNLIGICEAVEMLVSEGFQPEQTIYLAFAHDEEVGGSGAKAVSELLKSRGVKLDYVLDEGGSLSEGIIPMVKIPVAMVGIAEKGYLSVELSAESEGGHSSMPPRHTTIGIVARAITRLERNQFPAKFGGVTKQMIDSLAPDMPFKYRLLFANAWLFRPAIKRALSLSAESNASIRTTIAATIFQAGVKENVLPGKAGAVVNFRLLPGDSIGHALRRIKRIINDPAVKINPLPNSSEPSPVSDVNSASYKMLGRTILQIFPEATVAPYLVLGATDSRNYVGVADNIYKFGPERMKREDLKREHGVNERVAVKNFAEVVKFFNQLIRNSGQI